MRADATHRFEFEVDHGRRARFVCLARTRAEAEAVARHARASVRLVDRVPLGVDDGDVAARRELREIGLLAEPWADDVDQIVRTLDHARWTGDAMSVVPVAFLPAREIVSRGLRACGCGKQHGSLEPGMHAVEPPADIAVFMVEDGGWRLHLLSHPGPTGAMAELLEAGWARCAEACPRGGLAMDLVPECSVWTVAHHLLFALLVAGDLRPGELSCAAVHRGDPARR